MWHGKTVVCIASGPSLCEADCLAVQASGHPTIAVNSSWKLARFCQVIYAGDAAWWFHNQHEIDIPAQRWSCSGYAARKHGTLKHNASGTDFNSGARAIELAAQNGASRIILLGYDCSIKNGLHWHGKHEKTLNPTPGKCRNWLRHFERAHHMAKRYGNEIINCSRETAIPFFPRIDLAEALK